MKVYYTDIQISDRFGKLNIRLYFPTPAMRKQFVATHKSIVRHNGRRPLTGTADDIGRTRLNLAFYPELRDFAEEYGEI